MNPQPIQRRIFKTKAARDAAIERVKAENPDCISEAVEWARFTDEQLAQRRTRKPMTGPIRVCYAVEIWKPFDRLRKMFPGATDCEIVETVRMNRDKLVIAGLDRRVAGRGGRDSTQRKGQRHREKIRAAFQVLRSEHPDAKKTYILLRLSKDRLPKTRGYGERSIKAAVRDLK